MHLASRIFAFACLTAVALAAGRAEAGENHSFMFSPDRVAPWNGPACDSPAVANRLVSRFNETEQEYWALDVRLATIAGAHEVKTEQWDPPLVATRYCGATAYFADGTRREVVYWLRSEQGFAGLGWGLQYCVMGLDQHMAYAPACRMLRPL